MKKRAIPDTSVPRLHLRSPFCTQCEMGKEENEKNGISSQGELVRGEGRAGQGRTGKMGGVYGQQCEPDARLRSNPYSSSTSSSAHGSRYVLMLARRWLGFFCWRLLLVRFQRTEIPRRPVSRNENGRFQRVKKLHVRKARDSLLVHRAMLFLLCLSQVGIHQHRQFNLKRVSSQAQQTPRKVAALIPSELAAA